MTRSIQALALLSRIIGGLLLVFLAGCSAVRLSYGNAPTLSYWWLDSFVDFNAAQTPPVRKSLDELQAWHRVSALPAYAETLRKMQRLAPHDVTPAQICGLSADIRSHLQQLGAAAAAGISAFVPTLQPQQLQHLALQFDKRSLKWREDWLEVSPDKLKKRRLKQAVEQSEMLYSRLEDRQLALLRSSIDKSGFDPQLMDREIQRRQQDILQVLKEHSGAEPARATHVRAEVLAVLERMRHSPDPVTRSYQEKMSAEGCATLAALHNSTSPAQRASALKTLQDYEADALALAAEK